LFEVPFAANSLRRVDHDVELTACAVEARAINGAIVSMLVQRLRLLLTTLAASSLAACSDDAQGVAGGAGSGGTNAAGGIDTSGRSFNECGVAAPAPRETGQCTAVAAPSITNFDEYAGTDADSYTFSVSGKPPAEAVRGAILHVGDGSDTNGGTGVITTEMVTGEGDAGYALQVSDTNAMNWGGLLMFYFPFGGAASECLDGRDYGGVEFSVKGESPSGRFGINLGMLDTIPTSDNGLCDNPTASDCKDANVEFSLPANPAEWMQVQVPWSAFTPGVGSSTSCVPVTGQNVTRIVIQPFMSYPPPDYTFEPGAYALAVDNLRFY
jgi:hypothetical protein